MSKFDTRLTPELQDLTVSIGKIARDAGLDFFDTIFELVDYQQLNEIAAYGGFPTRYPHWRFGMEYDRLSKSYTYGLSIIYEMVINNDPCYAYLLRANNLVDQKTVIAHVFGHCDFFKNNYWFSKTNRKMLDQMANHATIIREYIEDIGQDVVESFIDVCLSLENLIDIYGNMDQQSTSEPDTPHHAKPIPKMKAKKYMDSYINPKDFLDAQESKQQEQATRSKAFPSAPQRDILLFLLENAPLNTWQKRVLRIIRDEMCYFAPQAQTKIINEGWATYWHSKMMTKLHKLNDSEIIDYCDHYAGIVANQSNQLNPYKLGLELLRHIERRWDRGQHGLEFTECDDPKKRREWNTGANEGMKKLFEVRKIHNDITFLDSFLDEEFCHESKLFLYDFDRRSNQHVISSRNFGEIKSQLLSQLTNFGQPIIDVIEGNYKNRSELLLKHRHEGTDLKHEYTLETLKNLFKIWQRPVHLETTIEDVPRRISFDGTGHHLEKI
jgi:stage V sporulation protein R